MKFLDHFPDAYSLVSPEGNHYIWMPKNGLNFFSENELWESCVTGKLIFEGIHYRQLRNCNKHSQKFNLILDNFSEIVSGNHSWKLIRQFKMA